MAELDVKIVKGLKPTQTFEVQNQTDSSLSATIKPGEPVKRNSQYVTLLADGEPEIGTDAFVGIAATESTETSSADGTIEVYPVDPNTVLRADATTSSNLADTLKNNSVTFDLSGGTFTIDENETDDPNVHGLIIRDVNTDDGTVDVMVNANATLGGTSVS